MTMREEKSKTALVTGAAGGIGRAIAEALAGEAAAVAVHYFRDRTGAEETAARIRARGARSALFQADLSKEKSAVALIGRVERRFGRLDILVNNVGPFLPKKWDALTIADWDEAMRVNLYGAYACLRAALPGMRGRRFGRIINIGFGRAGQLAAFPGILPYAAAKTALLLLTRTAAAGEAGSGITVNMVSPGLLRGGMLPRRRGGKMGPLGTSADVAAAVRFLASAEAGRISGTDILVAGTWKM